MHAGIDVQHLAALNRTSGYKRNAWMDLCCLTAMKMISLPQVGGQRWVELVLHSKEIYWYNSKRHQRLTDLPLSFELPPTDPFVWIVFVLVQLPTAASPLFCSRLGSDWNHHRRVKPHIVVLLSQNWGFPKEYFLLLWGWARSAWRPYVSKWCVGETTDLMAMNRGWDNQQYCSHDWEFLVWEQAGPSVSVKDPFPAFSRCYCQIPYVWLSLELKMPMSPPHPLPPPKGYRDWTLKCIVLASFIVMYIDFNVPFNVNTSCLWVRVRAACLHLCVTSCICMNGIFMNACLMDDFFFF